jgi:transposase
MIWDNAPFHRKKELHQIDSLTPIFLPSYSPELNPVARFYGEVRKSNANRLFENIEYQEAVIDEEVAKWMDSPEKMKKLAGYGWILEQFKVSCI